MKLLYRYQILRRLAHNIRSLLYRVFPPDTVAPFSIPRSFETPQFIVYTAIIGYDDELPDVCFIDPKISYVCFTNAVLVPRDPWTVVRIPAYFEDPKITSGYLKSNSHLIFQSNVICLWIDSNLTKLKCSNRDLEKLIAKTPIATLQHMQRRTVRAEIATVKEQQLDSVSSIERIQVILQQAGFPDNIGLSSTMFLVRDHRDPRVQRANNLWWGLISRGIRRDQLTFDFSAWSANVCLIRLDINYHLPNRLFRRVEHKNARKRQIGAGSRYDLFAAADGSKLLTEDNAQNLYNDDFYWNEEWDIEALRSYHRINCVPWIRGSSPSGIHDASSVQPKSRFSPVDPRRSWKREYIRRAVRGCCLGLVVGVRDLDLQTISLLLATERQLRLQYIGLDQGEFLSEHTDALVQLFDTRIHFASAQLDLFLAEFSRPEDIDLLFIDGAMEYGTLRMIINLGVHCLSGGCLILVDNWQEQRSHSLFQHLIDTGLISPYSRGFPPAGGIRLFIITKGSPCRSAKRTESLDNGADISYLVPSG